MPTFTVEATLRAEGVPTKALSEILQRAEVEGWDPDIEYEPGPGSTFTFLVSEQSFDALLAKLREIYETIGNASA